MKYLKGIMLAYLLLLATTVANAKVTLTSIFSDNMVLQQKSIVTFRGKAKPNSSVTLIAGWDNKKIVVTSDAEGTWSSNVVTPIYGGPFEILFDDGETTKLKGVLVGEVWFLSGQSNMEMPVKGFFGQPVNQSQDYIAKANPRRNIRLYRQPNAWSTTQKDEIDDTKWTMASSQDVSRFSAVGYVFGDFIEESLDVPVGLIQCAWSMSKIEAWMPRSIFESKFTDVKMPDVKENDFGWTQGTPTLLWNAMVNPWSGFPVAGVLWYQGEANTPDAQNYKRLFPAMVDEWREFFGNKDLPFFYAQLAPWCDADNNNTLWADFRQVQTELLFSRKNLGMVTLGDCGDSIFIHFPKKIEVGKRFAYLALNKLYGYELMSMGPIAKECVRHLKENCIWVEFDNGMDGLAPQNYELHGFEMIDAKGNVTPAKAKIINDSNKVKVWGDNVDKCVEVRYGYHDYYEASLFNNAALPASPFKMFVK
ncbi:MAG: sialate O-acetylesterase [Breznakibacter sp.]